MQARAVVGKGKKSVLFGDSGSEIREAALTTMYSYSLLCLVVMCFSEEVIHVGVILLHK